MGVLFSRSVPFSVLFCADGDEAREKLKESCGEIGMEYRKEINQVRMCARMVRIGVNEVITRFELIDEKHPRLPCYGTWRKRKTRKTALHLSQKCGVQQM